MRDSLFLFLNGKPLEILGDDASLTLAEYLRYRCSLVGTKIVCNEGDCGACSVLVGRVSAAKDGSRRIDYLAIDSCITLLYQLDQTHVVTVEGLGNMKDTNEDATADTALTPIQDAMVTCHGSQCGFCTPGFVMTMHGMIESETPLEDSNLRYGLSGNLCRCTGYVQIMDAGKSVDSSTVARIGDLYPDQTMIDAFDMLPDEAVCLESETTVFLPKTIDEAIAFRTDHENSVIVNGATDHGVLVNHGKVSPGDVICLASLQDFDSIEVKENQLRIGGGATWSRIEKAVEPLFPQYHFVLTRFGSPQIRNSGTLAGNLATGSPIGDSIPFHLVMDSRLQLVGASGRREVALADFYTGYRENVMLDDELIESVTTPLLADDERLALYKISKRRDMDISTLTLGLWLKLDGDKIVAARMALGGVGPTVMRMPDSESFLNGNRLAEDTLREAGVIARQQISPWSDVRGGAVYRLQLTENLMVKAFYELTDGLSVTST